MTKYILIENNTDFSQAIGIYDSFYTALGTAYNYLIDITEDELSSLPIYEKSDYDTGFCIRYREANGDDPACELWILTLEEGADGNTD